MRSCRLPYPARDHRPSATARGGAGPRDDRPAPRAPAPGVRARRVRRGRRPGGRRPRRRPRRRRWCSRSLAELLAAGAPDFAIVAVPTDDHLDGGARARRGTACSVLVEKPLAATTARGARDRRAVRSRRRARRRRPRRALQPRAARAAPPRPGGPARRRLPDRDRARRPVPRPRARRRRRQGPRDARPRPRALARLLARRAARRADAAQDGPRARGPRARHRPPRERRQLQLGRRLAVADQGAPHAHPRRARDARRRHADRGPDLLRQRRGPLGVAGTRRRCAASARAT